jgi:transcriptional regulator with XRE-family HTH domain
MRRALLDVSQEKLAESVGITFQQLQKYERGANRVSASRLYQFSQSLEVPVDYFFQEYSDSGRKARHQGSRIMRKIRSRRIKNFIHAKHLIS